jgi:hypothetical protein
MSKEKNIKNINGATEGVSGGTGPDWISRSGKSSKSTVLKCPSCGKEITKDRAAPERCPFCGIALNGDRGEFVSYPGGRFTSEQMSKFAHDKGLRPFPQGLND